MKLEDLKKEYIKTQPSGNNGWYELESKLGVKMEHKYNFLHTRGLALAAFVILLSATVLATAQAAKPGNPLYPVKILSDNTQAKISGNYEMTIEKRAQDVIDSQESQKNLDKATQEYLNTLEEIQQKPKDEEAQKELENTLKEQEQKFQNAQSQYHWDEDRFGEIIRRIRRARGEVEGARDDTNNNRKNNRQNHRSDDDD